MESKQLLGCAAQLLAHFLAQQIAHSPYGVGILAPRLGMGKAKTVNYSASEKIALSSSGNALAGILAPIESLTFDVR